MTDDSSRTIKCFRGALPVVLRFPRTNLHRGTKTLRIFRLPRSLRWKERRIRIFSRGPQRRGLCLETWRLRWGRTFHTDDMPKTVSGSLPPLLVPRCLVKVGCLRKSFLEARLSASATRRSTHLRPLLHQRVRRRNLIKRLRYTPLTSSLPKAVPALCTQLLCTDRTTSSSDRKKDSRKCTWWHQTESLSQVLDSSRGSQLSRPIRM